MAGAQKKGSARRRSRKKEAEPALTSVVPDGEVVDEIVQRRRKAVSDLETSGYAPAEIADALLKLHMNGDTPLFTFIDEKRKPIAESTLTYDELRKRAFQTVRFDLRVMREENVIEHTAEEVAHERWLLLRRLRKMLRKIDEALHGEPGKSTGTNDPKEIAALAKPAIEIAVRIGRLGGIESDKPIEIKLPEFYVARIDDDGVVTVKQEPYPGGQPEKEGKPN